MVDVITRFKLETTQYDSKLRDASKGLQAYGKQIETAGKDFTNFSQKAVEAARSLGTIASGANNTKDKLKDLVGAYNDVAKTYNKLTEQQRQTDFGKAMSQSLEQLQVRIKETKQELYGMGDAMKNTGGGGLFSGLGDKMSGALQVFGGNMLTKAAGAVANLGSEMYDMVQQGVELAKQGEGIRIAFERLGRGDILDGLRQATHGTVTDIELMKAAVKFNDFKLPLDELGTMLAFAQQKAKDTGQSVDYMVDSIVTGLGRKSLMILDNLGLSATEVKEKMKETGDMTKAVGTIIREQMSKAGDYVETAADRAAQANVSLQNKMEELGRKFAPIEEASKNLWTSMKIGILDIIGGPLATLLNQLTEAGRLKNQLNNMNGGGMMERFGNNLRNSKDPSTLYSRQLAAINRSINTAEAKLQQAEKGGMGSIQIYRERVQALKEVKKQYEDLYKTISRPVDNPLIASDTDKKKPKKGGRKTETVKTEEQLNNEEIQKLTQEYIKASDDRRKAIEGEIKTLQDRNAEIKRLMDAAQGKVAPEGSQKALSEELSKLQQERQLLSDPIAIEIQDQAIKDVQDEIDRLNGKKVEIEIMPSTMTPFEQLKQSLTIQLAEENIQVDETTLKTLMQTAIQNGIDGLDPQFASLQEKMREGMNIPDSAWEDLQTQINEKLKDLGIKPIKIDFKTGNLAKDGKETEKSWNAAAQAVQSVGGAMQSIEDPAAKVAGTIAQAIASIALGYAQATTQAATLGPWAWVAFAATGMAQMMSMISGIHNATGYAEGGIVKGNSYSGDNIMANGGAIGLNAGELVLNKAQQNTLASELQGSGGGSDRYMPSFVSGEQIWIALNAYTKRTGRGEVVTWR